MKVNAIIYVVDDDPDVLKASLRLLQTEGWSACGFASSEEFLAEHDPEVPGCLVLDLCLPKLSGLALQKLLLASGCERSVIFITGHGDVPASVQAMKEGAVDFLTKPFHDEDFLEAVRHAVEKDEAARETRFHCRSVWQRMETLTPREHQVLVQVIAGRLNKQIAADLGVAEKTIKVHRARAMEKMGVTSLAELVRIMVETDAMTVHSEAAGKEKMPLEPPAAAHGGGSAFRPRMH